MPASERADLPMPTFSATQWDLIKIAANEDPSDYARRRAAHALNDLCRIYRAPILAYLKRCLASDEDAEDLAQEFCAHRISPALLAGAAAEKGRFRSLLLIALKNFLGDHSDRAEAQRRGGRVKFVPLEEAMLPTTKDRAAADLHFDVVWATTVVERALGRLQNQYASRGDAASFDQLLPFLGQPADRAQLSALAEALHVTQNTIMLRVRRFRAVYARFVRQELSRTVGTVAEIEPETRYLLEVLSHAA